MSEQSPPHRVTVTSPRTRAPRARRPYPATREIDEQTDVGEVFLRSLMRTQVRLGLLVSCTTCGGLVLLPALFALIPALRTVRVLGLGLPWLILVVLVFPILVASGWFYVRQAERSEREFADFVERS